MAQQTTVETATFAAGCFWGVEAEFRAIPGVLRTTVGYTGGTRDNPSYQAVCTRRTGHAEAVQVTYDPAQVSYEELLDAFWKLHNPTQRNRQGLDWGTQYRSAIFTHDDAQARAAEAAKERAQAGFRRPIVTEISPASTFWPAEDYHQRYLEKRGMASCAVTVQS